jgi:DNA repair protein RadC
MKSIKKLEIRSRRVPLEAADPKVDYTASVQSPTDVRRVAAALLDGEDQEVFLAFPLDVKNKVLGYVEVARGAVESCPLHAREVFRTAVMLGASSVVVVHNHPSGDPAPSREDDALTARLVAAGKVLGILVIDHVIIAGEKSFSYMAKGRL